jgi:cyclohexanone monooxygenase
MTTPRPSYDVVIVGAGFAGLYMLHRAREAGLSAIVLERGDGVGGTWFWNRYPGARCDVESMLYSYSFSPELDQEWTWSERYATQPEILAYLEHVADRFDLLRDVRLASTVTGARFAEEDRLWSVSIEGAPDVTGRFVVMAAGNLSAGQAPAIPGLERFTGEVLHTGSWPLGGVDLVGKRVAVIGTGSSGIQAIPEIARQAAHTTVLQRTPAFSIPARNRPLRPDEVAETRARYPDIRATVRTSRTGSPYPPATDSALQVSDEERAARYEEFWSLGGARIMGSFADLLVSQEANDTVAHFVRAKIAETVDDPDTARRLQPHGYPLGAKRVCVDTDYYATFNRPDVELVDLRERPLTGANAEGLVVSGETLPADVIVMATGFDAMTGALTRLDLRGTDGRSLAEVWSDGVETYLGMGMAGFPNLFLVTGPGSPSVIGNVVVAIEQHVDWITDHLCHLREQGLSRSEVQLPAQRRWMSHVAEVAEPTLFPQAGTWYTGANVPGKRRQFLPYIGGVGPFRAVCDDVAASGYRGFSLC